MSHSENPNYLIVFPEGDDYRERLDYFLGQISSGVVCPYTAEQVPRTCRAKFHNKTGTASA